MPKYVFKCEECNIRFERTLKMGDHPTHDCPACKETAPRVIDGSFSFGFEAPVAAAPANSGVHTDDYPTADRAVGRSATERWGIINEREKVKAEARRQGETHALIRHTGHDFIDYEPMSETGLDARRRLAKAAIEVVRGSKTPAR